MSTVGVRAQRLCSVRQKINPLIAERDALRDRRQKADSQLKSIQLDMLQLSEDKNLKQECDRLKEDNWCMSTKRETADAIRLELDRHQGLLVAAQTEVDRLTQSHAETSHEKDVLSYELQQQREQFAKLKQSLQSVQFNAEHQAKRLASEKNSPCSHPHSVMDVGSNRRIYRTLREEKKWTEQWNSQLESKLKQLLQCKQLNEKCAHSGELLYRKQIAFDKITKRYNALESDFEVMLLEKEVIHELKGSLELAQSQYIKLPEARRATLEHSNAQLNSHMEGTLAELSSLDDLLLKINMTRVGLSRADRNGQLNEELPRAMGSPQSQTDDFINLQKQLDERKKELLLLREQEQEALRTVATLSEEKTRLQLRLVQIEQKWGAVKQNLATSYSQLQLNINLLIAERDALRDRLQKADSQLKSIQLDMLQLSEDKNFKQECDRLKEDNWRMSTKWETADALRLELDRHQGLLVAARTIR
ncbi:putative leucine-rich repeat-containing protein DDB_G0290503 [Drosophila obscura]|uniref:putative leucine-rich repeat-containing protein DDB_G0290503 n=1 Tax=Drosophila obscura TaxID=7282 RepID=UPI001BB29F43|nr:putative leucine-rich repeat-containing protein DDB_G0290503 [Drosophila obscura]